MNRGLLLRERGCSDALLSEFAEIRRLVELVFAVDRVVGQKVERGEIGDDGRDGEERERGGELDEEIVERPPRERACFPKLSTEFECIEKDGW